MKLNLNNDCDYFSFNEKFKDLKIEVNNEFNAAKISPEILGSLFKIMENNDQKMNEYIYNETEIINRLAYYSNRHLKFKIEIDMLNKQIKDLVRINSAEKSKLNNYEEDLNKLRQQVSQSEADSQKLKEDAKKFKENYETKVQEMEQMEKDYEETIENLKKTLDKESVTRKDLENQCKVMNSKREELLKLKLNLENKLKEHEQQLENKTELMNDAFKQIAQLKLDYQNSLNELEKSRVENEKFKSMLSYIKNFNL